MELGKITAWLASEQRYASGAALYAQMGTNPTYLRLFALPETAFSRQALVRELRTLVGQVKDEIAVLDSPARPPEPPAAADPAPAPVVPSTPVGVGSPALAPVRDQLRAVRDERSHTHAQFTARNLGKKARYALAARILELTDQELKLKDAEAHVLAHGRLPGPVPTAEVSDTGVLRQRLANLCSLRSKLKKKPDRAEDLATAEAEITLIRSKLNP
ncbi:hypothetical protein [Hymenobacter convexus]|uniref:hypothetical protein n=1 Tax=Hymenobacter sp. CA1UV-4 TaxID=3063782 RepID=UPI0027142D97|nr:hypothetical protein [Hymenobacter sp. CA1UV-4]MDO7853160.1 hypothetical protein [Hymenobacter sp. CA1UV-4]